MRCPNCDDPTFEPGEPCPACQFNGDPAQIEELAHVEWILSEIDGWQKFEIGFQHRQTLRQEYIARQRELEISLGLRLPPFTEDEAREAWPELRQRETLLQKMAEWLEAGLTAPVPAQRVVEQARQQVDELLEQLEGHPRPTYPKTDADRLNITNFLLEAVDYLSQNEGFVSPAAEIRVRAPLLAEKENLEIKLGLRPGLELEKEPAGQVISQPESQKVEALSVAQPSTTPIHAPAPTQPHVPLGERLWRSLLSERTLQALLFLGIFLLFTAAISFVIWGWKDFSAPMRVAIPTIFTAIFFTLGWYVRAKTPLYRSGIALSAIAALLIPIDFYTIYVNFNISPEYGPLFWFVTSVFCLLAYLGVALIIRSRFFGYLVGVAAGSTALALIQMGHQAFGLSTDWRTASLSTVAFCLIISAALLDYHPQGKFRFLTEAFRYLALLAVSVTMLFTLAWRYLERDTFDTLHYALTINWWLGAIIFGWGAVYYRRRGLGLLAALAVPIATFLTQAAIFDQRGVNPAWHAFGAALLVPLYFISGYVLAHKDDAIMQAHGRTAIRAGVVLLVIAALWPLTDLTGGAAAASSHAVLSGSMILAGLLWRRPVYLFVASLFSFTAATFAMTEMGLDWSQLGVGWASLAIAHVLVAVSIGSRFPSPLPNYARSLVIAGYIIAALALLPPLFPYNGHLLAYALGNWVGLTIWGARLAHLGQPGFAARRVGGKTVFHWFTALALPLWLWLLFSNYRPLDFSLPLALAVLSWGMVVLSYRLKGANKAYLWPWWLVGVLVSLIAPITAFVLVPNGFTPAIMLLSTGLLYFTDAVIRRQSVELAPAGLVTAGGYMLFLDRFQVSFDALTLALAVLIAVYFLAGLWTERRKSVVFTPRFLAPLYLTGHVLSIFLLWRIYVRPFDRVFFDIPWTDEMRLWGAAAQLGLGVVYGLYAWGIYKERWGHVAAWLIAASGGFIAITYSTGRGSSAAKVALLAIGFVLVERGLYWLRHRPGARGRQQAFIRLTWHLYKRPLLVTGWTLSVIAIGLALIRNLWLLGGGRIQQTWAVVGLLLLTGLYALSARLFRQARFMWFAAFLVFVPWTILTNLGWFTSYRPTGPGFAVSWVILAWALYLTGLVLDRLVPSAYVLPLKTVAHVLIPFSLLWGIADVDTSRFTFGLAIGFYGLAAILHHRRLKRVETRRSMLAQTRYLFPTIALIPVWCVYLVAWLLPAARHEFYGLMLVLFAPLGLLAGQWLKRIAPVPETARLYAIPAYIAGYASLVGGVLLVAHEPTLRSLGLLLAAFLMLVSAWLFKHPLWVYLAAVMVSFALLSALETTAISGSRYGWWLIALAAIYLALAWVLRLGNLRAYGTATLIAGFVLIACGLPPSSQDQIGAFWGYGSAALLYAITAFWLRQPLLLTPACALVIVPYAVGLQQSTLASDYYGLALLPGAVVALALGWWLDHRLGRWQDFPWGTSVGWPSAVTDRFLGWWGLPLYWLGFGLALASPFFTYQARLLTLNFLLLMPLFGWAIYYFRLRVWLLALAVAGHLAAGFYLAYLGWWRYPAWAWLRFLPVTLLTAVAALFIQQYRKEGSPLSSKRIFWGWSRPLYLILALDLLIGQTFCFEGNWAASVVTLTHAMLIAVFASFWLSKRTAYVGLILGVVALVEWLITLHAPLERSIVVLAELALGYGVAGYAIAFFRDRLGGDRELRPWLVTWELPLQRFSIAFSLAILVLTAGLGLEVLGWTVGAIFGLPYLVNLPTVQMVTGVLTLIGLLYLTAAFVQRRVRLGYVAMGMLLTSWLLHTFYVRQWDNVQWYVVPTGVYLLGIAYLEWQRGNKVLGRWLDYLALFLLMGTLFWQTILFGWQYALFLGVEGFLAFWLGSARRLRRFFYAGIMAIILAALGWLINEFWSVNQWIVFGLIGLFLVLVAILIERKLDEIKAWQEVLETWE